MNLHRLCRPWIVVLAAAFLYLGFVVYQSGGPLGLVLVGTRFSEQRPDGTEGYDGQFAYYIARDPAGAPALVDVPAYRYQRILYPLLARLVTGGNAALIPWALPALNLLGLVAGVAVLELFLAEYGVSRWYALPAGLYAGQILSLRVDLPEPPALALALAGMWGFQRGRWRLSAVFFLLAALTKETMLVFGAAYGLYLLSRRQFGRAIIFGAIQIIPFALYQAFLYRWLGSWGIGSGGAGATPFEIVPLGGLFRIAGFSWVAFGLYTLILGPAVIGPAIWAIGQTGKQLMAHRLTPPALALGLNALIILFLPFSTFREILAMLRFTVPLVALIILYSAQIKNRRALNYSFLWLFTLIFIIKDPYLQAGNL